MASLSQLDVVNGCLATMGESPLNALDNDHPFVQSALLTLGNSMTLEQSRSWWFNTDYTNLKPDALTGFVTVPADTLDLESDDAALVQRGRRLYDRVASTYDLRDRGSIAVRLVREVPFADLPTPAQHLIALRTWLDFQARYDADSLRYKELHASYTLVNSSVTAQNIRNSRVNLFKSPGAAEKLRRIRPMSGFFTIRS